MSAEGYEFEMKRDGLHRVMGGSIPKGSTFIATGQFGTGKSVLCQRLAYGFLSHGVTVTYVSTELTTRGFIEQMNSLDYGVKEYILSKRLMFIPVYPLIGEPMPRTDFMDRMYKARQLYENDILIVDTFSSLAKEDIDITKVLNVIGFFKRLAGKGKTVILTIDPDEIDFSHLAPFKSSCEILVECVSDIVEGAVSRTMYIKRFQNAQGRINDVFGFRVEPKIGFIVDITAVA